VYFLLTHILLISLPSRENYKLEAAYRPAIGHFFWGRQIKPGDVIDLKFKKPLKQIKAVFIVTGFDKDEDRAGNDRLKTGGLLEAKNDNCSDWKKVESSIDQWGKLVSNDTSHLSHVRCLRLQIWKTTSDWLVIRLIRIMLLYS